MPWPEPVILSGPYAQLKPLSHDHIDGLTEAVKDGELWKLWYTFVPKIAGMTTYMNVDAPNRRVEIGSTWYAARVQRSAVNTQCKLLLLTHAFEKLDCIAVEFRTHFFNHASRRGIERLGAKLDGILRNHSIAPNGTLRDTVVYSVIGAEWPTVRAHLNYQLNEKAR
jgi:RimJ/RimL family protein N-acetyltransferase